MGRALLRISPEGLLFATRALRLRPRGRRLLFHYARFLRRGSDLNGLDLTNYQAHWLMSTKLENVFTVVWLTHDY